MTNTILSCNNGRIRTLVEFVTLGSRIFNAILVIINADILLVTFSCHTGLNNGDEHIHSAADDSFERTLKEGSQPTFSTNRFKTYCSFLPSFHRKVKGNFDCMAHQQYNHVCNIRYTRYPKNGASLRLQNLPSPRPTQSTMHLMHICVNFRIPSPKHIPSRRRISDIPPFHSFRIRSDRMRVSKKMSISKISCPIHVAATAVYNSVHSKSQRIHPLESHTQGTAEHQPCIIQKYGDDALQR